METHEVADKITEAHHGHPVSDDLFRRRMAIYIGLVAMLLAITTVGGANATKRMLSSNIHASDVYSFYQAKSIRQTANQLAADQLDILLFTRSDLSPAARADIQGRIERYKATVARYESEPATGEGKQQLMAKAKDLEAQRDHAAQQDPNFEFAEALFQIAIVLGSVSMVSASRLLLGASGSLALLATLIALNGFFLLVHLPFE